MELIYKTRIYIRRSSLALWVALVALSSSVPAQSFTILPIARPSDPVTDGEVFISVYNVSLNDAGQVAFPAVVSRILGGLFLFTKGEFFEIAQIGEPAPGGGHFDVFDNPSLNQQGQVAFSAKLIARPPEHGVYFFDGDTIRAIARTGEPAFGCGVFSWPLGTPSLSGNGQVAFAGFLSTRGFGVFLYQDNKIRKIACPGDPAPGGGTFIDALSPSINDQGQVVFEAKVSPPGQDGIFLYEKEELRSIARSGDPTSEGGLFGYLIRPRINNSGQVAFLALGAGGGLWLYDEKQIRRILPATDPETGDEIAVLNPRDGIPHPFYFNDWGQMAFEGRRRSYGEDRFRDGLFFFDKERFTNIVFSEDPMPDPHGYGFIDFLRLSLNNLGEVAFIAGYPRIDEAGLFIAIPDSR